MRFYLWYAAAAAVIASLSADLCVQAYYDRTGGDPIDMSDSTTSGQDAKHIFVLFTDDMDPVRNPNVRMYMDISAAIQREYASSVSSLFWVRSVHDAELTKWTVAVAEQGTAWCAMTSLSLTARASWLLRSRPPRGCL